MLEQVVHRENNTTAICQSFVTEWHNTHDFPFYLLCSGTFYDTSDKPEI
jgi:hypothetical protein